MSRGTPRSVIAAGALVVLGALAGCSLDPGYESARASRCGVREQVPEHLPPFPEPARSPALRERPAGRVVPMPRGLEGLAFDPVSGLLAVGIAEPRGLVAFVDPADGMVLRRVAARGGARHLRFERAGGPLLVPAEKADALVIVPPTGGASRSVAVGRQPRDATSAARSRIFVVNEHDSSLSVVSGDRVVCTLPAPAHPGGVAADERGEHVGVVGGRSGTLRSYDARSLRGIAEVGVGAGPTHVVSNGRRRFYVADTRGHAILMVRTRPLAVLTRMALPESAPYGLAFDERRRELWVTATAKNRVVLFRGPERVRSFPTVRQPNSVAVDTRTGRVFVGGRYGELQMIDPPLDAP